jgi:hypothetical protein
MYERALALDPLSVEQSSLAGSLAGPRAGRSDRHACCRYQTGGMASPAGFDGKWRETPAANDYPVSTESSFRA